MATPTIDKTTSGHKISGAQLREIQAINARYGMKRPVSKEPEAKKAKGKKAKKR